MDDATDTQKLYVVIRNSTPFLLLVPRGLDSAQLADYAIASYNDLYDHRSPWKLKLEKCASFVDDSILLTFARLGDEGVSDQASLELTPVYADPPEGPSNPVLVEPSPAQRAAGCGPLLMRLATLNRIVLRLTEAGEGIS